MSAVPEVVLGTSGFSFDDWVGPFYPPGTRSADMLALYADQFRAVELNATYYRIPPPSTMAGLDRKTPRGFEFVVKAHQSMTHETAEPDTATFDAFRAALAPLQSAAVLVLPRQHRPWAQARKIAR